ncbi:MAG: hypothetical protein RL226_112 [Bacteroidota bacterium]|jgi:hypothetical protein
MRRLADSGIPPAVGVPLSILLFPLFWYAVYSSTTLAPYLAVVLGVATVLKASKPERDDFLKITFGYQASRQIRLIENGLLALPFAAVLLAGKSYVLGMSFLALSLFLALVPMRARVSKALPTPFYRFPFEFAAGFRAAYPLYLVVYLLAGIGVYVDNINIAIFALCLLCLVNAMFYVHPEDEYLVWVHKHIPSKFLRIKLLTAWFYALIGVLPLAVTICLLKPNDAWLVAVMLLFGLSYLTMAVLAKYSAFPNEQGPTEGIVMALCLVMPPLLIVAIPFFYSKALKSLYLLRHD